MYRCEPWYATVVPMCVILLTGYALWHLGADGLIIIVASPLVAVWSMGPMMAIEDRVFRWWKRLPNFRGCHIGIGWIEFGMSLVGLVTIPTATAFLCLPLFQEIGKFGWAFGSKIALGIACSVVILILVFLLIAPLINFIGDVVGYFVLQRRKCNLYERTLGRPEGCL